MMGVICAENAIAEQPAAKGSNPAPTGIVGWFKSKTSSKKSVTAKSTTSKTTRASKPVVKAKPVQTEDSAIGAQSPVTRPVVASKSSSAPARTAAPASPAKPAVVAPKMALIKKPAVKPDSKPSDSTLAVERAVVRDAERQAVQVRQTAAKPDDAAPSEVAVAPVEPPMIPMEPDFTPAAVAAESALQPVPIQQAPVLPNTDTVAGPQYFSATPAGMSNPVPIHPSQNWQQYQAPQSVSMSSQGQYWNASHYAATGPVYQGAAPMSVHDGMYPQNGSGMYPQTGAALYPAPRPGIPQQVGGIAIENQAFHPHEMLHAHRYRAIYPPYYYKVNGGWMVTPFGVWSKEDWKLQGTQVDVKYHSSISPFTLFKPPVIR
ncbi:MAG: hypothetical protein U0936_03785 [Planctomycetaceae bacterium]